MFMVLVCAAIAFAIQYALSFRQIQKFNVHYVAFRKEGWRAAIGRFQGVFHAGAILMLAVDAHGNIKKGVAMQGVTVFAGFKPFDTFNGMRVQELNAEVCKTYKLSYSLTKAVTDCVKTYTAFEKGEDLPEPQSPFQKIGSLFSKKTQSQNS